MKTETIIPLEIGTKVKVANHISHYGSKEAVIERVERGFKECNERTGEFYSDGLLTLESTIKNICIPYDFDGETLKVHHTDHTRVARFNKFYYTVRVLELNQLVLLSEQSFTVIE